MVKGGNALLSPTFMQPNTAFNLPKAVQLGPSNKKVISQQKEPLFEPSQYKKEVPSSYLFRGKVNEKEDDNYERRTIKI